MFPLQTPKVIVCGLAAGLCLAAAPGASATDLPPCRDADEALTTYQTSYLHPGQAEVVTIESKALFGDEVTNATAEFAGRTVSFDDVPMEQTTVKIPGAKTIGTQNVVLTWTGNSGDTPCAGRDDLSVRVVPMSKKIGDETRPRITPGIWHGKIAQLDKGSFTWKLKPRCAYGACSTDEKLGKTRVTRLTYRGGHYRAAGRSHDETTPCGSGRVRIARWAVSLAPSGRLTFNDVDVASTEQLLGTYRIYYRADGASRAAGCTDGKLTFEMSVKLR